MSLLYRILAWSCVALALAVFAGLKGYTLGADHAETKYLAAQNKAEQISATRYAEAVAHGNDLAAQLAVQQQLADQSIQTLRQEVPHVTIHSVQLPSGQLETLAPLALTRGTVCVYNAAWTGGAVPDPTAAAGADASAACTGADATQSSEYIESDWLNTDLTNAGLCRANSAQLTALIAYVRSITDGHR